MLQLSEQDLVGLQLVARSLLMLLTLPVPMKWRKLCPMSQDK